MGLRHGATASIVSTLHLRKLTISFAKHAITAYGIGVAQWHDVHAKFRENQSAASNLK
jgi:hypothetical protein